MRQLVAFGAAAIAGMFVSLSAQTQPPPCVGPLKFEQVIRLLGEGLAEKRVVMSVQTCGVEFELNDERTAALRAVNATDAVLQAIQEVWQKQKAAATAAVEEERRKGEQAAWDFIKDMNVAAVFEKFLKDYPDGAHAAQARLRVQQVRPALAAQAPSRPVTRPIPAPPDVAAPPVDAERTNSGLATKVLAPGSGTDHPGPADIVTVEYTGWSTKGVMFDSSYARDRASDFPLDRVIPGWSETVQLMVVGEKRRAWVPEELAYKGRPEKPQGMLVFDVELVSFQANPTSAPADVVAPPADAQRTTSGLVYKVLRAGTGVVHPKRTSKVTVHYTGWTTDGKMFDSSVAKGQPATFPLNQVIPGWTEGVQLMVEGEKTRFWIPQKLAYDGQAGAPAGMLVFDVELLKIER